MESIDHIVGYVPYHIVQFYDGWRDLYPDTARILNFKGDQQPAINYYKHQVIDHLDKHYNIDPTWSISIVPSSTESNWSAGLLAVGSAICNYYGAQNRLKALRRTKTIDKLAAGGNRDIHVHLNSICMDVAPFTGATLLLDDVYSTGNSLRACASILEKYGAAPVQPLAIAETQHG